MDENDLRRGLAAIGTDLPDRHTVLAQMRHRELAHARRRGHLAMGAAACAVVLVAGGIGVTIGGPLRGPVRQQPGSGGTESVTTTSTVRTISGGLSATPSPASGAQSAASAMATTAGTTEGMPGSSVPTSSMVVSTSAVSRSVPAGR